MLGRHPCCTAAIQNRFILMENTWVPLQENGVPRKAGKAMTKGKGLEQMSFKLHKTEVGMATVGIEEA